MTHQQLAECVKHCNYKVVLITEIISVVTDYKMIRQTIQLMTKNMESYWKLIKENHAGKRFVNLLTI